MNSHARRTDKGISPGSQESVSNLKQGLNKSSEVWKNKREFK